MMWVGEDDGVGVDRSQCRSESMMGLVLAFDVELKHFLSTSTSSFYFLPAKLDCGGLFFPKINYYIIIINLKN